MDLENQKMGTMKYSYCLQAEVAALTERQAANKHKLEEYHRLKVTLLFTVFYLCHLAALAGNPSP